MAHAKPSCCCTVERIVRRVGHRLCRSSCPSTVSRANPRPSSPSSHRQLCESPSAAPVASRPAPISCANPRPHLRRVPAIHRQSCEPSSTPPYPRPRLHRPGQPPSVVRITSLSATSPSLVTGVLYRQGAAARGQRTLILSIVAWGEPKDDAVHGKTLDLRQRPGILEDGRWWMRPARNGRSQNRVCIQE
jgi:hypothetical protein